MTVFVPGISQYPINVDREHRTEHHENTKGKTRDRIMTILGIASIGSGIIGALGGINVLAGQSGELLPGGNALLRMGVPRPVLGVAATGLGVLGTYQGIQDVSHFGKDILHRKAEDENT